MRKDQLRAMQIQCAFKLKCLGCATSTTQKQGDHADTANSHWHTRGWGGNALVSVITENV